MADNIYLYEFLYRGRADGTGDFHVQLAHESPDPFARDAKGKPTIRTHVSTALTPKQAKDLGYDLPKILASFDSALHQEVNELRPLRDRLEDLQGEHADLVARHNAQRDRADRAEGAYRQLVADLQAAAARDEAEKDATDPDKNRRAVVRRLSER